METYDFVEPNDILSARLSEAIRTKDYSPQQNWLEFFAEYCNERARDGWSLKFLTHNEIGIPRTFVFVKQT